MKFATAAILAGGKSSRMGFDKQLLSDRAQRLLSSVLDCLREEFPDILVVTSRPELYRDMGVRTCADAFADRGPLAGIQAALANSQSEYVYLLACDMPVVCLPYIRHMKERLRASDAPVCLTRRQERYEPFNAFYSRTLLEALTKRLQTGSNSLFYFISASAPLVIEEAEAAAFDAALRMFTNINTQSEYEAYLDGRV